MQNSKAQNQNLILSSKYVSSAKCVWNLILPKNASGNNNNNNNDKTTNNLKREEHLKVT